MATSVSISDDLKKTDYSDSNTIGFDIGTYDYTFKVDGGGRASLKIEAASYVLQGEKGKKSWRTIVDKQKVVSGSTLTGSITLVNSFADEKAAEIAEVKVTFSREFLGKGVEYDFTMEKQ